MEMISAFLLTMFTLGIIDAWEKTQKKYKDWEFDI